MDKKKTQCEVWKLVLFYLNDQDVYNDLHLVGFDQDEINAIQKRYSKFCDGINNMIIDSEATNEDIQS